jgi:hypothetical protein
MSPTPERCGSSIGSRHGGWLAPGSSSRSFPGSRPEADRRWCWQAGRTACAGGSGATGRVVAPAPLATVGGQGPPGSASRLRQSLSERTGPTLVTALVPKAPWHR